jgi:hypothetical protein
VNDLLANASPGQIECRHQIADLEASLRKEISEGRMEQTFHDGATQEGDQEAQHHFAQGVYVRSMWLPAGTVIVGRMHLQSRVCIVSAGRCRWVDEFNPEPVEVQAPWVGEFKAGSKTVVVAIEDTYWSAITGTDLGEPMEILRTLSVLDVKEYRQLLEVKS